MLALKDFLLLLKKSGLINRKDALPTDRESFLCNSFSKENYTWPPRRIWQEIMPKFGHGNGNAPKT